MSIEHGTKVDGSLEVESYPASEYEVANKGYVDNTHSSAVEEGEPGPNVFARVGIRAAFVWWEGLSSNVSGHGYYQVQMASVSDFSSVIDDVITKSTWATFDGLTTGTTYFWRVRAVDAAGNVGAWTTTAATANPDQVTTPDIGDGQVSTVKIANLAVTTAKINDLAVSNAKIANASISTAKIQNLAVSSAKIDDLAVTNGKIANLAVDTAKIKNLSVETIKIADLNVTIDKEASPTQIDVKEDSASALTAPTAWTEINRVSHSVPSWAGAVYIHASHSGYFRANTSVFHVGTTIVFIGSGSGGEVNGTTMRQTADRGSTTALDARDIAAPGSSVAVTGEIDTNTGDMEYLFSLVSSAFFRRS